MPWFLGVAGSKASYNYAMHDRSPAQHSPLITRRTVSRPITIEGVTLFTGAPGRIEIRPNFETVSTGGRDSTRGVRFCVHGAGGQTQTFAAHIDNLASEARRTVLRAPAAISAQSAPVATAGVQTVEHLLSALWGLGITDALIDVQGPEVPVGDGSSLFFVEALRPHVAQLKGPVCDPIVITRRIEIVDERDPGVKIVATPLERASVAPRLELQYDLDYRPQQTGITLRQSYTYVHQWSELGEGGEAAIAYARELAPARTFCTFAEAQALRQAGLFSHLSPRDMLVLGPDARPIENALRFDDEPARHKVLDMLGDLALVGTCRPIVGCVHATRTGHAHNHRMAAALLREFGQE